MGPINRNSCISDHDKLVLDAIFNPSQIGGTIIDETYDENDDLPNDLQDVIVIDEEELNVESTKLEIQAVNAAENRRFDEALALFQKSIDLAPQRSSTYNNRAQTYRLIGNDKAALADLDEALKLSNAVGRTGCKALCQRGILRRKHGDIDEARTDFTKAANLGSKFAKIQLVEINPYAALCNQMLQNAFEQLSPKS